MTLRLSGLLRIWHWHVVRIICVAIGGVDALLALVDHIRLGMAEFRWCQIAIVKVFWCLWHLEILHAS